MRLFNLADYPLRQLTSDHIEAMATVFAIFEHGGDSTQELLAGIVCYKQMEERLSALYDRFDKVVDQYTLAIIASCTKSYKEVWVWCYQLACMAKEKGAPLDEEDVFSAGPFAMGYPSDEAFEACWNAGKFKTGPHGERTLYALNEKSYYPEL